MVTITVATLWSENDQALATWSVARETVTDEGGNESAVIAARYNGEAQFYSPNFTDEEIQAAFESWNAAHGA